MREGRSTACTKKRVGVAHYTKSGQIAVVTGYKSGAGTSVSQEATFNFAGTPGNIGHAKEIVYSTSIKLTATPRPWNASSTKLQHDETRLKYSTA